MVLLIFTASAFAITSTAPVMTDGPNIETYSFDLGGGLIQPCDPISGGGGGGGW